MGFSLAAYSVVGNDTIQTLGTFLSSNKEKKWWVLWLFAASILTVTLLYGYLKYNGDVSYGRLSKYPLPENLAWYYLLPPIVLLILTRTGIPVSTSFLILTFFNEKNLEDMVFKSLTGYTLAFGASILLYLAIALPFEKKFILKKASTKQTRIWTVLQWCSTGFLWSQWLIQDFANIYVYLPRDISFPTLVLSLFVVLGMLAYIIASRGGAIQGIVNSKTNTRDIRSATIIDFIYGVILYYFKELNNIPMSTTWVFIGILAGREIAMNFVLLRKRTRKEMFKTCGVDFLKVLLGLVISIALVLVIKYFAR